MARIKVRVFTFASNPREQNSYVVGTWEVRPLCVNEQVSHHPFLAFALAEAPP